jgi:hypothetical protein
VISVTEGNNNNNDLLSNNPITFTDISGQCTDDHDLLVLRRMSIQIPISSIQECKYSPVELNSCVVQIACRDSLVVDFTIKRSSSSSRPNTAKRSEVYSSGLMTEYILPSVWCSRLCDDLRWKIREDKTWILWAKYLRMTMEYLLLKDNSGVNSWLRKAMTPLTVETDYHRMHVEEAGWIMSDLNARFELCSTYPQTLVFPEDMTENDIQRASQERSRERLPSLVWMHPFTHVALCRSAQPLAGLNKTPENDKRLFVAIKNACSTGLPIRIADCRPQLNAQVNSVQGKGYENVSFYGGPSVCSLAFLDIHNVSCDII